MRRANSSWAFRPSVIWPAARSTTEVSAATQHEHGGGGGSGCVYLDPRKIAAILMEILKRELGMK
jgi:hypothetical protein